MYLSKAVGCAVFFCLSVVTISTIQAAPRDVSHTTTTEQRLNYLERLLQSRSGERLAEHNGGETKQQVMEMLHKAREAVTTGDEKEAAAILSRAVKVFMDAVRELPEEPEKIARFKERYENMRSGLKNFIDAQKENKERFATEQDGIKTYDKEAVDKLLDRADTAAARSDYEESIAYLKQAQSLVTGSLQDILDNRQLVIKFDISTPEKEYAYELRRYRGYEGLVSIAIDVKKPDDMVKDVMLDLDKKARSMFEAAREKADQGDYPVAIRMLMDATETIRRALKMVGAAI